MSNKTKESLALEHQKFLAKMCCTKEQIKQRKKSRVKEPFCLSFQGTAKSYFDDTSITNKIVGDSTTGANNSILANLYKETPEVQKQIIEKARRCAPAYSKGSYQYITDAQDIKSLGRKNVE